MVILSNGRKTILRLLWESEKPISLDKIARKAGVKKSSAFMHLLGLRKEGYAMVCQDGSYVVTESGKEILGLPKVDMNLAKKITSKTSTEKAFHFYVGIGKPLGESADSLVHFWKKLKTIDLRSIEFHNKRGDFELWTHYLGDVELAKRLRIIKAENLSGEEMRNKIVAVVKTRCDDLMKKFNQ